MFDTGGLQLTVAPPKILSPPVDYLSLSLSLYIYIYIYRHLLSIYRSPPAHTVAPPNLIAAAGHGRDDRDHDGWPRPQRLT